jgi:hypothetical protein
MGSRRSGLIVLAIPLLLAGITGWLLWTDPRPAPVLRHSYLIPTLWGAFEFGLRGGALVSLLAVLLYAPLVLPAFEGGGLTRETVEGLVVVGWLAGIGPLAGTLVNQVRARAERYETLLALQRTLAGRGPLDCLLGRVAEQIRRSFRVHAVTLIVAAGGTDPRVVRCQEENGVRTPSGPREDSAVTWVWNQGRSLFIPDIESDPRLGGNGLAPGRPRQAFLVPLQGQSMAGVMAVEQVGELPRWQRAALEALGDVPTRTLAALAQRVGVAAETAAAPLPRAAPAPPALSAGVAAPLLRTTGLNGGSAAPKIRLSRRGVIAARRSAIP